MTMIGYDIIPHGVDHIQYFLPAYNPLANRRAIGVGEDFHSAYEMACDLLEDIGYHLPHASEVVGENGILNDYTVHSYLEAHGIDPMEYSSSGDQELFYHVQIDIYLDPEDDTYCDGLFELPSADVYFQDSGLDIEEI